MIFVGELNFPFAALVAAAVRLASIYLGFAKDYNGDILGEEQWEWLEETLLTSPANFNILVTIILFFSTIM